ncbi:HRDC domain-containing protein [Geothermobacter hydrogeniphilus]|nr:HRDC domain-containing protein [Geothermobacter hydrogeniphilus]
MQYHFFRISAVTPGETAEEFNRFLRSHRVLNVNREFVSQGENSFWALAVEYLPGEATVKSPRSANRRNRVDYKELLPPDAFQLFVLLREWRKQTAEQEGVPVYTIFTNEQLAEMAQRGCASKDELQTIDGIGQGRLEKYAEAVLGLIRKQGDEAGR